MKTSILQKKEQTKKQDVAVKLRCTSKFFLFSATNLNHFGNILEIKIYDDLADEISKD